MVQPAIAPRLLEGRKASVRAYALVIRTARVDAAYVYEESLVSFGAPGDADAVVHGGTGRDMRLVSSRPEAADWASQIAAATGELLDATAAKLWKRAAPGVDYWALLGLDFLPAADGRLVFLEANAGPRLWLAGGVGDDLGGNQVGSRRRITILVTAAASRGRLRAGLPTGYHTGDDAAFVPDVVDSELTRPLLVDVVELLAAARCGGVEPAAENRWRRLPVNSN